MTIGTFGFSCSDLWFKQGTAGTSFPRYKCANPPDRWPLCVQTEGRYYFNTAPRVPLTYTNMWLRGREGKDLDYYKGITSFKTIWWKPGDPVFDIPCLERWTTLGWGYHDNHLTYLNLARGSTTNKWGLLTNLGPAGEDPSSHLRSGDFSAQMILTATSIC